MGRATSLSSLYKRNMRKALFVQVEDLKKIYGNDIKLLVDWAQGTSKKMNVALVDKVEVTVVAHQGPYSLVRSRYESDQYNGFIVPKELLKEETIPDAIDVFKPILDKLHPNQWFYESHEHLLYIHYPELEITNTLNLKHKIYDLVVRFKLTNEGKIGHELYGKRYSYSDIELFHGYAHSHLRRSRTEFDNFCTGGSSKFTAFMLGLNKVVSPEEFEIALVQLKAYLEWESLEGKPHMMIEAFHRNDVIQVPNSHSPLETGEDMNILELMTDDVLYEITKDPATFVDMNNGVLLFDPTLDPKAFYQIEKELIQTYGDAISHHLFDYEEATYSFVKRHSSFSHYSLPPGVEDTIAMALHIEPKLIRTPEVTPMVTVKRLSASFISDLIMNVNKVLLRGINPVTNAKGNSITKESNSSVNTRTVQSNSVLA